MYRGVTGGGLTGVGGVTGAGAAVIVNVPTYRFTSLLIFKF